MSPTSSESGTGRLIVVVARARNGTIGRDGDLPWRLPADLRRFKAITMGHPIVMGRRTHESIGRVLPGRENIVLTSGDGHSVAQGCLRVRSLDEALAIAGNRDLYVVGGAGLYCEALPRASRIHLTEVHADVPGDTFFDLPDPSQWMETAREEHVADSDNPHDFAFVVLDRR